MMEKIIISTGYKHNNTYKKLNRIIDIDDINDLFEEEIIKKYPHLFCDNGNVKKIHIETSNKEMIVGILKIAEKEIEIKDEDALCLTLLWNFPRRQYDETSRWVCMSGIMYDKNTNMIIGSNFVVSDNVVTNVTQKQANNIIELINKCCD